MRFSRFYLNNTRVIILRVGKLEIQRVGRDVYRYFGGRVTLPFSVRFLF